MSDDNLEEPKKHSNIPVRVPRCTGTAKRTGKQCMMPAIPGGTVCRKHGGSAPQVKAAANRRRLLEEAHADIELWGGRKDIHPAQALLELVQSKAAEVCYWEFRVSKIKKHSELTWGVAERTTVDGTSVKFGNQIEETTVRKADIPVELKQLYVAQRDLAAFSAASLRAGVDEAMVTLAKSQAAQIVNVLRAALSDDRIDADPAVIETVILEAVRGQVEV